MTPERALQICGNQSRRTLLNMVAALRLHRWNNTPQEELRLEAARVLLQQRKGK